VRALTPRLTLLSAAHFSIDAYSSFLSPLLPLLVARLGLSLTQVGTLVVLSSFTSSLSQPLFGLWSDRLHRPWFVVLGPLLTALFMSAGAAADSFPMLVALIMIGGLGAAAFHPQAAVLAGGLSARRAVGISIFVTGGTLGFSLGPLFAVTMANAVGLERMWLAAIPGLVVGIPILFWFARVGAATRPREAPGALRELRPVWRPLTLIYFCGVFRSAVGYGFTVFLPLLLTRSGWSVTAAGYALTAYLVAGALGGFFGGWAAERWGGRGVLVRSFALAMPLFYAFLLLPIGPGLGCLIAGSFMLQSTLPVNVTLGQELSPRHASTISSLLMGAAWGIGMLLVGPIGALADAVGLRAALGVLSVLLAGGCTCAMALPAHAGRPEPGDPVPAVVVER
jgi:FSR family fosmidomycin resistance protein-like MFS transporter